MIRTLLVALGLLVAAAPLQAQQKPELKTHQDKVSYSIGLDIGRKLHAQELGVDPAILARGLEDGLRGNDSLLSDEEMRAVMARFRQEMVAKRKAARDADAAKNLKAGEDFLAANKNKPGIKTTESGIQYKVLEPGKGKSPDAGDSVVAHYKGTLIDGTKFDSSYDRGEPATFPVSGVIPGWQEVLQMMKPGAKWMVYIPAKLAYGERGAGRAIGPNETLIFQIELLEVKKKDAGKQ